MNFKKYHVSKNLWNEEYLNGYYNSSNTFVSANNQFCSKSKIAVKPNTAYWLGVYSPSTSAYLGVLKYNENAEFIERVSTKTYKGNGVVFTTDANTYYININFGSYYGAVYNNDIIIAESSTPLPYEPYSSEVWHDTPHYIHNTSTDTITTPAVVYANSTTATVGLKGNMYQASGVSPTNPIQPQECGDLETTGTHAGQYKIPISSAGQTTNVYLGEVQSTRRIKKLVLTGSESNWGYVGEDATRYFRVVIGNLNDDIANVGVCTHYIQTAISSSTTNVGFTIINSGSQSKDYLAIRPKNAASTSLADFKSYLATQYAAGTPVTVWYVLAEPTTGIVNEPLRKIGDYVDTVSGITIPTIAGANTISVDTTLQPSEVTVNYKGWHPVADVHEYDSNYTIATMQALTIAQLQTHTISELQGGEWL